MHIKAAQGGIRGIFDVMPHPVIEFTTDRRFVRRARELRTFEAMLRLYCRGHGHQNRTPVCGVCGELLEYATRRLERCLFGDAKPTCTNCVVHCYSADMREQVRIVMRWAGPRMLLRHPILGILHKLDARRPAPLLPARPENRRGGPAVEDQQGGG
jgi:hypothetical protein